MFTFQRSRYSKLRPGAHGYFPGHVNTAFTLFILKLLYNLTTLYLNGTFSCVDFMDDIMGDIPDSLPVITLECCLVSLNVYSG